MQGTETPRPTERGPKTLLTATQAADLLGVSERTFHKLRHEKWMPQPLLLGPRLLRWHRAEIEAAYPTAPRLQQRQPMPAVLKRGQEAKATERAGAPRP